MNILLSIVLLVFSAFFSGLTLGLLSLSAYELKRKMELGDARAAKIYPIRVNGNQLLVTLLVGNVTVNSALSVYLGSFYTGWLAIAVSTVLITIFGEIVPQAAFSRFALKLGAQAAPFVQILMKLLWPIAYPLSILLDKALGDELPQIYSKEELVKIVEEHSASIDSDVEADELKIVENALNFGDKFIEDVMTPRSVVVGVEESEIIGPKVLDELHQSGHSRFPIFKNDLDHIVGILYMRDLIQIKDKTFAKDAAEGKVYFVNEKQNLDQVLNAFVKTKNHLYVVVNEFKEMVGIITMEDVVEEILGREIVDEFDKYEDMREVAKQRAGR